MDNLWQYSYAPMERALAQLLLDAKEKTKKKKKAIEKTTATMHVSSQEMESRLSNEVTSPTTHQRLRS
jgi:hypothetical protein